ncbi:hypothetical protein CANARDRAFT_26140 [[Candida] arabinofermentans NRRL YB-2248]|uniref:N-acetyltransferase domain-containing protein n=1 Tax=[Candida] arabinofermentans NRRL YB-2248 TaxID=983967 RepID=A0A1E4T886_9ASCO|nr:hypothetical protein CANARDRAFT_26140 [[Candida] arabinofermentans NRRL YB-2248]
MSSSSDKKTKPQHLCIRPLTIYDLEQVNNLEIDGFPIHERCTIEKLKYRLTVCPELCSGLFIREFENKTLYENDELPSSKSTIIKETLIGHIISTKISDLKITDRSMELPKFINTDSYTVDLSIDVNNQIGHVENGSTIGIHSVVINSEYRGLKLGSLLIKDYLQKMNQQFVADRVSLISNEKNCSFYENLGFINNGISDCKFAGETWYDLYFELRHEEDEEDM